MTNAVDVTAAVILGGFLSAFILGVVAARANVCTMGAIADVVNMGHWNRMRIWLLAIAVAIIGTSLLSAFGLIDLSSSIYQRPRLNWLSLIVGGVVFGIGMTMAGGCANKTMLRIGGGSLRSFVVLIFLAISAYMTLRGLFGQWRVDFLDRFFIDFTQFGLASQDLPALVAKGFGMDLRDAIFVTSGVIGGLLLVFCFMDPRFRRNHKQTTAGLIIGLIVIAGWYVTGHIGHGENPETLEIGYFATNSRTLESMSFVAPAAYSLELLLLWTDKSLHVTFGIATALGVVLGSMVWTLYSHKKIRLEGFHSPADTRDHIFGGVLMGFGGVTALGCTFGQGITGMSTLAIGSIIALASIIAGAVAMMKYMHWREERS